MSSGGVGTTPHARVHTYYHGTIDVEALTVDSDDILPAWYQATLPREDTGYNFSRYTDLLLAKPTAGINQFIANAGGTGSRVPVESSFQFWPNVGFDQRGTYPERVTVGQTVNIPYCYVDRSTQQTITFFTDTDTNPFNGVRTAIGSVTHDSRPAGSIGSTTFPWTPTTADIGTHYIGAKATNTRTDLARIRYDYFLEPIIVEAPGAIICASEILIDNLGAGLAGPSGVGDVSFAGSWAVSSASGSYGPDSLYSAGAGLDTYSWRTPVLNSGQSCTYAVEVRWTAHANRSTTVPITVSGHTGGPTTKLFNQQLIGSQWVPHGTYTFPAGAQGTVQVSDQNGQAAADAVRFVLGGSPPAVTFSFSPTAKSVSEGGGSVSFTLNRSSGTAAQTVYVSTTQTEGFVNSNDYTGLSNVAYTFAIGETAKTVTINITNDAVVEPNETFGLIAQQNTSDPVGTYLAKATFTITNND